MPETTPGYAAALAAAEMEAEAAYIHQLATELIESTTTEPTEEAVDHGH